MERLLLDIQVAVIIKVVTVRNNSSRGQDNRGLCMFLTKSYAWMREERLRQQNVPGRAGEARLPNHRTETVLMHAGCGAQLRKVHSPDQACNRPKLDGCNCELIIHISQALFSYKRTYPDSCQNASWTSDFQPRSPPSRNAHFFPAPTRHGGVSWRNVCISDSLEYLSHRCCHAAFLRQTHKADCTFVGWLCDIACVGTSSSDIAHLMWFTEELMYKQLLTVGTAICMFVGKYWGLQTSVSLW